MSGHEAVAELRCALLSQQPDLAQARIGLWGQTSLLHEGPSAVRLWVSCMMSSSMCQTLTCCCSRLCADWGAIMPIAVRAAWLRSGQDVCVGKDLAAAQWVECRPDHSSRSFHKSLGIAAEALSALNAMAADQMPGSLGLQRCLICNGCMAGKEPSISLPSFTWAFCLVRSRALQLTLPGTPSTLPSQQQGQHLALHASA